MLAPLTQGLQLLAPTNDVFLVKWGYGNNMIYEGCCGKTVYSQQLPVAGVAERRQGQGTEERLSPCVMVKSKVERIFSWVTKSSNWLPGNVLLRLKTASSAKATTPIWGLWRVEELFSQQHNLRPDYTHAGQGRPQACVWLSQWWTKKTLCDGPVKHFRIIRDELCCKMYH